MHNTKNGILYFNGQGYAITDNHGKPICVLVAKEVEVSPEEALRRAWFYLGRGIKDVLDEQFEFVTLGSNTKVVDQLQGALIDDPECKFLCDQIRRKGLSKFAWVNYMKLSDDTINQHFRWIKEELVHGH